MDLTEVVLQKPFNYIKILQTKRGQPVSSEINFLLENVLREYDFSKEKINLLEPCCGIGIISLMLNLNFPNLKIDAFDIQENLIELAKKNNLLAKTKINFFQADLKTFVEEKKYELIIANPPFYTANSKLCEDYNRAISRFEICCNMKDVISFVKRKIKNKGKIFLMYPKFRLTELSFLIKKVDLKLTKIFDRGKVILMELENVEDR